MGHLSSDELEFELLADPYFGPAVQFILANLGNVQNKIVLDSGCGPGYLSVLFALKGAYVIGIDKRKTACIESTRLAHLYNAHSNCRFVVCKTENMPIADATADVIFSRSTIQYMEYKDVISEYMRILKPLGILALVENLRYNPIINIYRLHRRITAKTPAELAYVNSIHKYIHLAAVDNLADRFVVSKHREFHFFRIISIYLSTWSHKYQFIKTLDAFLCGLDDSIFALFPFMRHFAWFTALICFEKKHG